MFLNIPGQCDIRVFTERGDLVHQIEHRDGSGDEAWSLITFGRQVIAPGIYVAHFEATENIVSAASNEILIVKGDQIVKKFVVVR